MTGAEKAIVGELADHILEKLQEEAADRIRDYREGHPCRVPKWDARKLVKNIGRHYRFWDRFTNNVKYTERPRLIKAALGRLKAAGKLVTTPVRSRQRKFDYEKQEYYFPIQRWEYQLATSPLDALAALNPLA